jgi:hypothetical protein
MVSASSNTKGTAASPRPATTVCLCTLPAGDAEQGLFFTRPPDASAPNPAPSLKQALFPYDGSLSSWRRGSSPFGNDDVVGSAPVEETDSQVALLLQSTVGDIRRQDPPASSVSYLAALYLG